VTPCSGLDVCAFEPSPRRNCGRCKSWRQALSFQKTRTAAGAAIIVYASVAGIKDTEQNNAKNIGKSCKSLRWRKRGAKSVYVIRQDRKKEGYEQIADALLTTADNEREHASWNLKLINALKAGAAENADEIHIEATVETSLGDTAANLRATIAGEHYETTTMYPEFADVADSEGLPEIAKRLRAIGVAEAHHEERNKKNACAGRSRHLLQEGSEG